jgi:hypothetical protein
MEPGTYKAEIVDYGMYDKSESPTLFVKFITESNEKITWFGSLKEKQPGKSMGARDVTFSTLFKMGWNGDVDMLVATAPETFVKKNIEIVVAKEAYNGKEQIKVKYINIEGEGNVKRMDAQKAASLLGCMKGDILKTKESYDKLHKAEEDIPF